MLKISSKFNKNGYKMQKINQNYQKILKNKCKMAKNMKYHRKLGENFTKMDKKCGNL